MVKCPNCGEPFSYGWPCLYELMLFMLTHEKWKCSRCNSIILSDHRIAKIPDKEMEQLAIQFNVKGSNNADIRL